jgi:hypothetical protein
MDTIDKIELGMNNYTLSEALRVQGNANDLGLFQIKLEIKPKK